MQYFVDIKTHGRMTKDIRISTYTSKGNNVGLVVSILKKFQEDFESGRLVFACNNGKLYITGDTTYSNGYKLDSKKGLNIYSCVTNKKILEFVEDNGFVGDFELIRFSDDKGFDGFEVKKTSFDFFN